jgi:lysophospholipase L1-like esterase
MNLPGNLPERPRTTTAVSIVALLCLAAVASHATAAEAEKDGGALRRIPPVVVTGNGNPPASGEFDEQWARAQNNPAKLRILPLGDSITRGSYLRQYRDGPYKGGSMGLPNADGGGYRKPLQDRLRAAGVAFDFVGDLSYGAFRRDGTPDSAFDPDHHGLAGFGNTGILRGGLVPTPRDVLDALKVSEIRVPGIVDVLERHRPDVVLLMSGANGFNSKARDQLILAIGDCSQAHLFVATIPPQKAPRPGWDRVAGYNDSLPAIVETQRKAGKRISLVDMQAAIEPDDLLADGVHPGKSGMKKMADAWLKALAKAGKLRTDGDESICRVRSRH